MPSSKPVPPTEESKFQRYRQNQADRGLKLLRVWVPDPRNPEFAKQAKRQALLLRSRAEEHETLEFIQAAGDWSEQ